MFWRCLFVHVGNKSVILKHWWQFLSCPLLLLMISIPWWSWLYVSTLDYNLLLIYALAFYWSFHMPCTVIVWSPSTSLFYPCIFYFSFELYNHLLYILLNWNYSFIYVFISYVGQLKQLLYTIENMAAQVQPLVCKDTNMISWKTLFDNGCVFCISYPQLPYK